MPPSSSNPPNHSSNPNKKKQNWIQIKTTILKTDSNSDVEHAKHTNIPCARNWDSAFPTRREKVMSCRWGRFRTSSTREGDVIEYTESGLRANRTNLLRFVADLIYLWILTDLLVYWSTHFLFFLSLMFIVFQKKKFNVYKHYVLCIMKYYLKKLYKHLYI